MYRIVQIVDREGKTLQVPMTAKQADFCQRLTELRAAADPAITFHDVVIEQIAEMRRTKPQDSRL